VADLAIEVEALTKRFGSRVALDGLTLAVPRACAYGFLGPNGAGKTTLVRLLLGMTTASAGTMRVLGRPLPAARADALARTGAIIEEPRFHPFLTGRENLRVVAAVRDRAAAARIDASLELVGLGERADERVKRYSLGMRQRLGLARCLLADPELLILDEPTNGLDPAGIHEFRLLIRRFVEEGRTVFLSSHLLGEVERICDRVAIVDRGSLVTEGALAELATGASSALLVGVSSVDHARRVLQAHPAVEALDVQDDGLLRVETAGGAEASAAAVNRALVEAGVEVHRLESRRASLEDRFLDVTSRLGDGGTA
jgi:ABC-2 type transport system ATP-binding protein